MKMFYEKDADVNLIKSKKELLYELMKKLESLKKMQEKF